MKTHSLFSLISVSKAYHLAADAKLVYRPDRAALARARRAYVRGLRDPGVCEGDFPLLLGLAIAEAQVGHNPGWIPETQRLGVEIARLFVAK